MNPPDDLRNFRASRNGYFRLENFAGGATSGRKNDGADLNALGTDKEKPASSSACFTASNSFIHGKGRWDV